MKSITEYKDGELILICAFRYALGRSTYIVLTIVDMILNEWPNLPLNTQKSIKKEIQDAVTHDYIGMDMDKMQWVKILELEEKTI